MKINSSLPLRTLGHCIYICRTVFKSMKIKKNNKCISGNVKELDTILLFTTYMTSFRK